MKFICDGVVLSDAAITVSKACASKTLVPVLECIKLNARNDTLTLTAYDGELSIEKKIKAEVFEELISSATAMAAWLRDSLVALSCWPGILSAGVPGRRE